jgi:hypothetical protein
VPSPTWTVIERRYGPSGAPSEPKIRSALTYYEPLLDVDGCEVRLHSTTLYASLFRYDDEITVNPHAYGQPASANPTHRGPNRNGMDHHCGECSG